MRTLILDPPPAELEALLESRRRRGADHHDEVWEGVLHMTPAPSGPHADVESQLHAVLRPLAGQAGLTMSGPFNLGETDQDFRVPDAGLHRSRPRATWHPTAALVVEVLSPGDESWQKLPFYAAHGVDELLIVDLAQRAVHWWVLEQGEYVQVRRSRLVALGPAELAGQIDWP
ncbi:MAG: Uma2 family endonuclease [Solirubrobacteraceae bacterium]